MSESNDSARKVEAHPPSATKSPEVGALTALPPDIKQRVESELKPLLEQAPKRQQILERVNAVVLNMAQEYFHGPLPHPSHFEQYDRVVPGSADRILTMAEKEQAHRHGWERSSLTMEFVYSMAGLIFGFALGLSLIGAGLYSAIIGHETVAAVFVGTGALGMVTSFIQGRNWMKKQPQPQPAPPPQQSQNKRKNGKRR